MARTELKLSENVPGDFFVDSTCIDCDLCRQLAPNIFKESGDQTAVYHQPEDDQELFDTYRALVTCPTASIGGPHTRLAARAAAHFPEPIEDNVFFCGYASEDSYGAASYFIAHPEGNILVDSPRFAGPLVKQIEKLGGIRYIFLTHRDDVADHDLWAKHFNADRIMHQDDTGRLKNEIEMLIEGQQDFQLGSDLVVIPTPGHTKGHIVLLYRDHFLFTGDHIWWSDPHNGLNSSRTYNWYSWPQQLESLRKLMNYNFEWILPGHGRRAHTSSFEMKRMLQSTLRRLSA